MFNPKVSILIPLYNSEKYISETIESCLNQEYQNIEIIIVDDGSTDSGLQISRKYEKDHKNILVEVQNNSGAPVARNRAFELSTGEYIQYLDADDILHPDKIKLQMDELNATDEKTLAFGRWGTFQKSIQNVIWKDLPVNKDYDDSKQFLIELWESGMAAITPVWLVPRKLIEESDGWDESLAKNQDGEFFARLIISSDKILFVRKSISYYRKDNENSISKQISRKALISNLNTFKTYTTLMNSKMDNYHVRKSLALVYSRFLNDIPPKHQDIILETKNQIISLGFKEPLNTLKKFDRFLSYFIGRYNVIKLKKIIKNLIKHNNN